MTTLSKTPLPKAQTRIGLPYAEVVFNLPVRESFTYRVPDRFLGMAREGMRVFVPFGRRRLTGYIIALSGSLEKNITLKPIEDILDTEPVISQELLKLTKWIADYYHSSWGEAIKAALPAGLDDETREVFSLTETGMSSLENGNLKDPSSFILNALKNKGKLTQKQLQRLLNKNFSAWSFAGLKKAGLISGNTSIKKSTIHSRYEKSLRALPRKDDTDKLLGRSPKQRAIYQFALQREITVSELKEKVPSYSAPLRQLQKKGLVEVFMTKTARNFEEPEPDPDWIPEMPLKFSPAQENCFNEITPSIDMSRFKTFLLHGVTGSGKTELYIRCIQRVLEQRKTAIMIVPEISLTPQTVSRFLKRFGSQVAILHSGLSQAERYQEWKKTHEGKVSIVVGARSAVFAPFKNLGVIVIDEEHDSSYKQDSTPRYHARDTAIVRAQSKNAVVILGSATPSLESLKNAQDGKYHYLSLKQRVHARLLPSIRIIDMGREKNEKKNFSILSISLKNAVRDRLERGEQVFLFLNRRGTANYVFCRECGFVFQCGRCSVTLTFHGHGNTLQCHYCNFTTRTPKTCADCSGDVIRFSGFGTQKLESETQRLFPKARILRLDRDTTRKKSAFDTMHQKMQTGQIDILIGTQMITKGHDFPNVTLVGVVHADISLNIPDFRSSEKTFQLLTQVAGRAGRGKVPGQVIIQTHNSDHFVLKFVREHDYEKFTHRELAFRKKLNYPPFSRLIALEIESENERSGQDAARKLKNVLTRAITKVAGIEMLGPTKAALYKINNRFRWHFIIRSGKVQSLRSFLHQCRNLEELRLTKTSKIKISMDVDPINFF